MGMDGCAAITKAAEGAGYRCQGDGWHGTKAKARHFGVHCDAHAPRQLADATEKAAKAARKPERPAEPVASPEKLGTAPAKPRRLLPRCVPRSWRLRRQRPQVRSPLTTDRVIAK